MEEITNSEFDQFEKKQINRRALLPIWIKVFCWIFMILGGAAIISFLTALFGHNFNLSLYGLETNEPISLLGSFILTMMLLKGFTAFSLWTEKDFAIQLGKIDAVLGIIICLIAMIGIPIFTDSGSISFRLEILFLIPYYNKLDKIKNIW